VAVIDISLKAAAGLDLMKRIKERDGHVCILVWSMHIKSLDPECALRAGALGYINMVQPDLGR
jgi:DNA-binding NarL/FixJ family response regulator